jgi:hypothetical protein
MSTFYSLRIKTDITYREKINIILNKDCNYLDVGWGLEVVQEEEQEYFDFINYFLDLLEDQYIRLEQIGVLREHISIWMIYEYNNQCNFEFIPRDLKRLGENEISLCVSCYEI